MILSHGFQLCRIRVARRLFPGHEAFRLAVRNGEGLVEQSFGTYLTDLVVSHHLRDCMFFTVFAQ